MKTLVTGGTGFTGSHLVRRLLQNGHEVRVLDNSPGLFHDELANLGAQIEIGSITDQQAVERAVKDCEVVHHLAAAFRQLKVTKQHYWSVNVEGTRMVADAALRFNVRRLVYCSTQGVHGHIKSVPGNEHSPIAPEDYYQYTKYEGERVVHEYVDQGLDAVTIRPTAIYGPGDPARFLMLFRSANKGRFLMFGRGNTYYHPVHITNLVDAFELAAEGSQEVCGETFLIGDRDYWTLNELVERVGKSLQKAVKIHHIPFWPLYGVACACEAVCSPLRIAPPIFRRRANWFRQDRGFSIEKARRLLRFNPRVDIESGLLETGEWYRQNGYV